MAKKKPKQASINDQLRALVDTCGISRYRLAIEAGIDHSALSRFMSGERGLSAKALDRIGEVLDIELTMHGPRSESQTDTKG